MKQHSRVNPYAWCREASRRRYAQAMEKARAKQEAPVREERSILEN